MKRTIPVRQYRRIVMRLRGPYTRPEAAQAAGVSADQIDDWESGRTQPSRPGLRKLVDHYIAWTTRYKIDGTNLVVQVLDLLTGGEDVPDDSAQQREGGQP